MDGKELGQHAKDERLLRSRLGISIPAPAVHVERALTEEKQVEALLKQRWQGLMVFSQWNMCNSRIDNEGVTLNEDQKKLQLNEHERGCRLLERK
jgi:hypothetical protein